MRRSTRFFLGFFLLAALVGVLNLPAWACSCGDPPPVEDAFATTSAVFIGRVVGGFEKQVVTDESGKSFTAYPGFAEVLVEESFRGPAVGARVLLVAPGFGSCSGMTFLDDTRYLVFGWPPPKGERLAVNVGPCGRTRPFGFTKPDWEVKPEEDLAYLRKAVQEPAGVTLSGRVIDRTKLRLEASGDVGLPKVRIILESPGVAKYETESDAAGNYVIRDIKPGKYFFSARPPNGCQWCDPGRRATELNLFDRGSVIRDPLIFSASVVAGRVVDAAGAPVAFPVDEGVLLSKIDLIACDESGRPIEWRNESDGRTREGLACFLKPDGTFNFSNVSVGHYLVVIGADEEWVGAIPVTKTYYPAASNISKAKVIRVRLGESVENLVLTLPEKLVRREIVGTVIGPDGKPVSGVSVELQQEKGGAWRNALLATTDETGHFRLIGFQGQSYRIYARHLGGEREMTCEVISAAFTCDGEGAPLILQLVPRKEDSPVADTDLTKDGQLRPEGKT
jgi:hypothetical protein